MAVFLSNGAVVTLNSVDISAYVTGVTINRSFDELEITAMGDSAHKFVKGLEASTITLDLLNNDAASGTGAVTATLAAAWGTTVPLVIKRNSGAISTTNPEYQTTVLVNNTQDLNGAVGDISNSSITFTCNSTVVQTTTGTF